MHIITTERAFRLDRTLSGTRTVSTLVFFVFLFVSVFCFFLFDIFSLSFHIRSNWNGRLSPQGVVDPPPNPLGLEYGVSDHPPKFAELMQLYA